MSSLQPASPSDQSRCLSLTDSVKLVPATFLVIVRTVTILGIFALLSVAYRARSINPQRVTKGKTPMILLHGSDANQLQWCVFRRFLESRETGHCFSLNLNSWPIGNDRKSIREYAEGPLKEKIEEIQELYARDGFRCDKVILVGHSMGGLIAGEYATMKNTAVKVDTLVAMSTPWMGCKLADWLFDVQSKPTGAFVTYSPARTELVERVMAAVRMNTLRVYTFSSSLDPMVRPSSSALPIRREHQMHSNFHDHYSSMIGFDVARRIQVRWILPHTEDLLRLTNH